MTTEIGTGPAPVTPEEFAELVNGEWRKSVEGIVEAGRWLVRAKDELEHGEFGQMVDMLVFGDRTARRLMAVGRDERLRTHVSVLPPSWGTLYELSRLDDKEWAAVEPHLTPTLERKDIKGLLPKGPDPDPAPEGESNGVPWGDEDKWCWKLKNLYKQAPKRSQNAFRKWFDQQVVAGTVPPQKPHTPLTKTYKGRSPLVGIRTSIGTLVGLAGGFGTTTAAECAPDDQEAEEWSADLKQAASLINRFRKTLKKYRSVAPVAEKDPATEGASDLQLLR